MIPSSTSVVLALLTTVPLSCGAQAASACKFKQKWFTEFDLTPLTKDSPLEYTTEGISFQRLFNFNFCEYLENTQSYAAMTIIETGEVVTFDAEAKKIVPYQEPYTAKIYGSRSEGSIRGVEMTYASSVECKEGTNYSLTLAIECNTDQTRQGEGDLIRVDRETACNPFVLLMHEAGCPDYFVSSFTWLQYWKPQLLGAILAIIGPLYGFIGLRKFPMMSSLILSLFICLFTIFMLLRLFSSLAEKSSFFLITLGVCAGVCIALTFCLKKRRMFKINITGLALTTGFFSGNFLYALIYQTFGWYSWGGCFTVSVTLALVFGVYFYLRCTHFESLKLNVALLGGVTTMRGISLLCGGKGYPFDSVQWVLLRNDQALEISNMIWLYLFIYLLSTVIYLGWLSTYSIEHVHRELYFYFEEQLDDEYRRANKADVISSDNDSNHRYQSRPQRHRSSFLGE